MTERQEFLQFIKKKFPIGYVVYDSTCSVPYTINKRSVYIVSEWKYDDYNDLMRPKKDEHYTVDFLIKNPGKYSRIYELKSYPKGWILKKYETK